ncbi:Polymyxin resistance protein ArnA_DH, UDP-glucuronic acid decarboxylase / Polymyxin resistance protein ArnA_FT, UDP-4-amino-4-deoxy-L-arabinose formylase [Raoultella ornithinolytica]|nr:Polymyxin resistance protein ArnA_DH, UDP-glucuronic acid decarboxylase / Polymyxin resistance protein ArnA_FT, UDP-4-amino-4-deoxy-L-arabinose formylase [Raoultella ornithinolytica]
MKAVVFAYHDMGCAGIQSLLDSGYESPLFSPIRITLAKTISLARLRVLLLNKVSRCGHLKMLTTRCGLNAFAT